MEDKTRTVHIRFTLDTPVILNNLLHLDAVLAARIAHSYPHKVSAADLCDAMPIPQRHGVYLCSAGFFNGIPDAPKEVCFQQNIWTVAEFDRFFSSIEKPYFPKGRRDRNYPTNLDVYPSRLLPHLDFLATVYEEGFSLFEYLLRDVDGLGKKTSHGFGRVTSVRVANYDGHPWVTPGEIRMVSRALPVEAWENEPELSEDTSINKMSDYTVARFPYYESMNRSEPCFVPNEEEPLRFSFHENEEVMYADA